MTFAFPITDAMTARLDAREDAVSAAQTIIRSKAQHLPSDIRLACHTLMTWGNSWDWVEGYQVLRALDRPKPAAKPDRPQAGTIRDGLMFLGFAAVVLILGLAG
jgi:hypothetical protein